MLLVATPTPFDRRGRVDHVRLRAHVLWLASHGVDGFVPCGTTGEYLYLSDREREAVQRTVADAALGKPVIPCTWDRSPITTAWLCNAARDAGCDGALLPPPLYYRVDQASVARWFATIAAATELPLHGYHVPGHVPTPIAEPTYASLLANGVLHGLKDSSGDPPRVRRLAAAHPGTVWAGSDRTMPEARGIDGLRGFVSAAANAWPGLCVRLWRDGEMVLADALLDRVHRLKQAGGVPALKALLGMGCRMPLMGPDPEVLEGLPPPEEA